MIGQEKIVNELFSYQLKNLPKTIMLLGESGCGKHTLAEELANHFSLPLIDITENISPELLNEIKIRSIPSFYLISVNDLTEKNQNSILKFIEEPGDNTFVILLSNSVYGLLDTVVNRCAIYEFQKYTAEELNQIIGEKVSEEVLNVCATPGQLKVTLKNYDDLNSLCNTMVTKMDKANFSNALSIVSKINLKDEYDKFDLNVFLRVLMLKFYESYKAKPENKTFIMYNIVNEESKKLIDGRLNKEVFMYHLITRLWRTAKEI